jgi:hypothetical protein
MTLPNIGCKFSLGIRDDDHVLTSEFSRPDNTHADAEAEGMALANFIFAKPFSKGLFG